MWSQKYIKLRFSERSLLRRRSLDLPGQERNDLVQIADDTEVSDVEDRSVLVFVDRNDEIGLFHTCHVLDRTGYADREVDLRTDGLAGLADLQILRLPAGINDCTGAADRSVQRFRQLVEECEVLGAADTAAAGDKDLDRKSVV